MLLLPDSCLERDLNGGSISECLYSNLVSRPIFLNSRVFVRARVLSSWHRYNCNAIRIPMFLVDNKSMLGRSKVTLALKHIHHVATHPSSTLMNVNIGASMHLIHSTIVRFVRG